MANLLSSFIPARMHCRNRQDWHLVRVSLVMGQVLGVSSLLHFSFPFSFFCTARRKNPCTNTSDRLTTVTLTKAKYYTLSRKTTKLGEQATNMHRKYTVSQANCAIWRSHIHLMSRRLMWDWWWEKVCRREGSEGTGGGRSAGGGRGGVGKGQTNETINNPINQ